jgi:hypothetical protein
MYEDLILTECKCCHQMICEKALVRLYDDQETNNNSIIQQLKKLDNLILPSDVCKPCFSAISNNSNPPFSILNNVKFKFLIGNKNKNYV